MNRRMVLFTVGQIVKLEAVLFLIPLIVSLIYREACALSFLISIAIALIIGVACTLIARPSNRVIYAKEGFVIVAMAWLALSAIGALPFYISREIPRYIDSFFETVSGFTTTGASILTDVEAMSNGLLFWRSFTHWIGGMGVLVFIMAVLPTISDRSIHILRAEVPGPIVGKLVPKIKETAKILYLIYIALTALEVILLMAGGMPLFDSLIHSFGTAGTGGMSSKAASIAAYNSYLQWVITIFMFLFGLNFNLFYLILLRKFRSVIKSGEMLCYFGFVAVAIVLITINIYPLYNSFSDAIRLSSFQVSSIITTTGYSTADFNTWPSLAKGILLILMMVGGCAGSTAGGLKVSRIIIMFKSIRKELARMLHPRSVSAVRFEGKNLDEQTTNGVATYFAIYIAGLIAVFFILCFEQNPQFDLLTNISASIACFNNVGPGLGAVGPAASYAAYSGLSKIVLSFAMLLGRLELFPLLITFSPSTWAKK